MLNGAGHRTLTFFRDNREIDGYTRWQKARLGIRSVWSLDSAREIRSAQQSEKPDLVHFHNFMPLLSPALYYVCKDLAIPVVQTLHNYRLLCPAATLYRDGKVCEECLGKLAPWPGVVHKCYRQDRMASAAVGVMITTHELIGTWRNVVDRYIALTEFARRKLAENGIPEHTRSSLSLTTSILTLGQSTALASMLFLSVDCLAKREFAHCSMDGAD